MLNEGRGVRGVGEAEARCILLYFAGNAQLKVGDRTIRALDSFRSGRSCCRTAELKNAIVIQQSLLNVLIQRFFRAEADGVPAMRPTHHIAQRIEVRSGLRTINRISEMEETGHRDIG